MSWSCLGFHKPQAYPVRTWQEWLDLKSESSYPGDLKSESMGKKYNLFVKVKSSQSLLYCQFFHMYRTYIQRIEIALLSDPWCIQITLNTNSRT